MQTVGFLLAVLFFSAEIYAFDEPPDFRGLKWGASIQELKNAFPQLPIGTPSHVGNRILIYHAFHQSIGNVSVDLGYGFLDDRFSCATIFFKSVNFATLRDAFVTRYGQPHKTDEVKLKTRMNAEYVNSIFLWKGPTLSITLEKYAGRITDGMAILAKHEYQEEERRVQIQRSNDAAKGL